jgi:4-alpha-glucanotransferase
MLEKEIRFWEFVQYKFWQQWDRLHAYANEKLSGKNISMVEPTIEDVYIYYLEK